MIATLVYWCRVFRARQKKTLTYFRSGQIKFHLVNGGEPGQSRKFLSRVGTVWPFVLSLLFFALSLCCFCLLHHSGAAELEFIKKSVSRN